MSIEYKSEVHPDGSYYLNVGTMSLSISPEPNIDALGGHLVGWLANDEGESMGLTEEVLHDMLSSYFEKNF